MRTAGRVTALLGPAVALAAIATCAGCSPSDEGSGPADPAPVLGWPDAAPAVPRVPRSRLPESLTAASGPSVSLRHPALGSDALSLRARLSRRRGAQLALSWWRDGDLLEVGGRWSHKLDLGYLPTAICAAAPRSDTVYVAGWEPDDDRCLVEALRMDAAAWRAAAAGGHVDPEHVERRLLTRSAPGGGVLVRAMVCHPAAGRLILLPEAEDAQLHVLDIDAGGPVPWELPGDAPVLLPHVRDFRAGRLVGPVGEPTFALVAHVPGRVERGCVLPPETRGMHALVLTDAGLDGRFERVGVFRDATYWNLRLVFDPEDDGTLP